MYFKPGTDIPMFGNINTVQPKSNKSNLSVIDLPTMKIQAHCHEGANGTAHFKKHVPDKNEKHINLLDSYQFAMGDLYAEKLGLKRIKK